MHRCNDAHHRLITLLTDFGYVDGYAGVMKGVILKIVPDAIIVDITHGIEPQDITGAALVLWGSYRYFPHGAVHCVVVDPEVGTGRRSIVVRTRHYIFVAPDNGVISWAIQEDGIESVIEITNTRYMLPVVSQTFHGRDVFAPIAAHVARGVPIEEFGHALQIDELVQLPPLSVRMESGKLIGCIVHIDRFGNAITNLKREEFERWLTMQPTHKWIARIGTSQFNRIARSYADAAPNQPLILFNSYGLLEVAINRGHASNELDLNVGDEFTIECECAH